MKSLVRYSYILNYVHIYIWWFASLHQVHGPLLAIREGS